MKPVYLRLVQATALSSLLMAGATAHGADGKNALAFPPALEMAPPASIGAAPPRLEIIDVEHIFFAYDKAELDERARRILDATARRAQQHHSMVRRILIQGHTDEVASVAYNYRLADRRVDAVKHYLYSQGVPASIVYSAGLGEQHPIDEGWTREGRRRNRHVEIYLIEYLDPDAS